MQVDHYRIQRFLALSDLYFRLTGKTSSDVNNEEMEEFLEAINDCSPPAMSPEQYVA
jgi:hypothetical protein